MQRDNFQGEISNFVNENPDSPESIRKQTREALGETLLTRSNLIPLLQHVQAHFGYLPRAAIMEVARLLGIPGIDVYSTATFYHQFRFNKPGRRSIKVCIGTACHSRGSSNLLDLWKDRLGIEKGETTSDGEFDLDGVPCVGCCVMAPVITIAGDIRGKSKPADVDAILLSSGWQAKDKDG